MNKRLNLTFCIFLLFAVVFLQACQAKGTEAKSNLSGPVEVAKLKAKPFKNLKLQKEWVLKDIDPKLPLDIVSMTANKNGVYVLVKNTETKRVPPKKLSDMTNKERDKEIESMKWTFGRILTDEERKQKPGTFGRNIALSTYWFQHYSHDGQFLTQWNDTELQGKFVKPNRIGTDESGDIYVTDYGANKIMKFAGGGKLILDWKINDRANGDIDMADEGGFIVYKNLFVYVVSRADDGRASISKFDTNGKLIGSLNPRKDFWIERNMSGQLLRISEKSFQNSTKEPLRISDITINEKGEIFVLDRELNVIGKLDDKGAIKKWYPAILNDGFNPMITRPLIWNELNKMGVRQFNTTLKDMHMPMYMPNMLSANGDDIFVTLSGFKPFGIIDAVSVNTENGNIGYLKQGRRSGIGNNLGLDKGWDKLVDLNVMMSFHNKDMFIARPVEIIGGPGKKTVSIIQNLR